jgi:uncharacterized protein involved in exopolysaccharide biosynthesis
MSEQIHPFLQFILKHRKINIGIIIPVTLILIAFVFFVIPLQYTAQVTILPTAAKFSGGLSGQLGALGKLAGIDFGGSQGLSQEMYIGILKSKRLLDEVINKEYSYEEDGQSFEGNLVVLLEIEGDSEREIVEKILKAMREDVLYSELDPETGILVVNITTENAILSADIANYSTSILNKIVKSEVQKEFRQKLEYLENKISEIEDSLKIAENDLEKFLETNSDPTVPKFQLEQLRLRRNLEIQTEMYIEFNKQMEVFIADNMLNLSDIKILDSAYPPYRKSRPKRILLLITYVMLFGFLQLGVNGSILIYRKLSTQITVN